MTSATTPNESAAPAGGDLPSMRIGEIVLQTARYDEMTAWYRNLLGMEPYFEHVRSPAPGPAAPGKTAPVRMCFFRLHLDYPYPQNLVVFDVPGTRDSPSGDPGLNHLQLRNASLADLCERYRRLKRRGILPYRSMDHGPSTSFYYRDPDQNAIELAASSHASVEEYLASFGAEAYVRNPSGVAIDPDSIAARYPGATGEDTP